MKRLLTKFKLFIDLFRKRFDNFKRSLLEGQTRPQYIQSKLDHFRSSDEKFLSLALVS